MGMELMSILRYKTTYVIKSLYVTLFILISDFIFILIKVLNS